MKTVRAVPAARISEMLLKVTGDAMMSGDFETFSDCFILPQEIETFEGMKMLRTIDEMKTAYEGVRQHLMDSNITLYERHCITAVYADNQTIEATHMTRIVSNAEIVQTPFPSFSVLKWTDGRWKIASTKYAIANAPAHVKALRGNN